MASLNFNVDVGAQVSHGEPVNAKRAKRAKRAKVAAERSGYNFRHAPQRWMRDQSASTNTSINLNSVIRPQHCHRRPAVSPIAAPLHPSDSSPRQQRPSLQLDKLVGMALLVVATTVFLYYTIWTLLIPFVDEDHPLQGLFPPRVWAIRIPVILILLASTVVGSFLAMVMIRSQRKKAAKAAAAKASQKNK
ncbi:hypothetical protein DV736_g2302, partial [Chaetothyriales sp. CBS 134916]